jgi:hypothetical protein
MPSLSTQDRSAAADGGFIKAREMLLNVNLAILREGRTL